ncbi:MAG: SUMF1/EgtB/PvdO family nonheme iron enzyme, partial [Candidatus Eisenbacteria bacterium]|nr:SUMF1/EgtB/PvdO family nonheme iron enzyme [Candidatus Eisenbacteria bacterium]
MGEASVRSLSAPTGDVSERGWRTVEAMAISNRQQSHRAALVRLALFSALLVGFFYLGCAEDDPQSPVDQELPQIDLTTPTPPLGGRFIVADSIFLVARARDNTAVDGVQFYARTENDTVAQKIGQPVTQPDSVSGDWGYYSQKWLTGVLTNGTTAKVFAEAVDPRGNLSRSEPVDVFINNVEQRTPPNTSFRIFPPSGNIETVFEFDPTGTSDPLALPLDSITVRWDFDGDGVWDIPLSEGLTAADKVTRTFSIPGFYEPKLEAFNTYYPGPGAATQELEVTNVGGRPRPQSEMIRIESGTYTIGAIDSAQADADELGIHTVDVNTFYIEKNEVTTTLYSKYLNAARDSAAIIFTPPGTVRDTLGNVLINFNESKVRYAVDPSIDSFYVAPGFENHPVTGVSWYGAR